MEKCITQYESMKQISNHLSFLDIYKLASTFRTPWHTILDSRKTLEGVVVWSLYDGHSQEDVKVLPP
jgi:hypothetical protein